jgi:hypothetical protein
MWRPRSAQVRPQPCNHDDHEDGGNDRSGEQLVEVVDECPFDIARDARLVRQPHEHYCDDGSRPASCAGIPKARNATWSLLRLIMAVGHLLLLKESVFQEVCEARYPVDA